jgi:hypothetical protein
MEQIKDKLPIVVLGADDKPHDCFGVINLDNIYSLTFHCLKNDDGKYDYGDIPEIEDLEEPYFMIAFCREESVDSMICMLQAIKKHMNEKEEAGLG